MSWLFQAAWKARRVFGFFHLSHVNSHQSLHGGCLRHFEGALWIGSTLRLFFAVLVDFHGIRTPKSTNNTSIADLVVEREARRNVELMWLTGHLTPDFKTIADFRRDNARAYATCVAASSYCAGS